jgi:hypothetical protein
MSVFPINLMTILVSLSNHVKVALFWYGMDFAVV